MTGAAEDGIVELQEYGRHDRPAWADFNWRPLLNVVEINGRKLNYVRVGNPSAPAVVLIHGLAGRWQNWIENIQALAEDFDVIALDLPGFGASRPPVEAISIPGYARTVVALLDMLGIERAHLIGNSMGGQTAAQTAIDFPERVNKLILVSPAGYSTSATPKFIIHGAGALGMAMARVLRRREFLARRPGLRRLELIGVAAHPDKLRPETAFELTGVGENFSFEPAAKAVLTHDFRDRLETITAPTLIVWGQLDHLVGVGDAYRFARRIPGSRKVILRDTGHVSMIERPAWFNATAREFLLDA